MIAAIADTHMPKGKRELPAECVEKIRGAEAPIDVGGRTIAVVHDAGPSRGRLERMRARFPEADAVVFGHSHLPLHEERDGFQIFNPGSPTERRRAPHRSMGLLRPTAAGLRFEHVWLG